MKTIAQAIEELVADWPDPTPEQRDKLRALLTAARSEAVRAAQERGTAA